MDINILKQLYTQHVGCEPEQITELPRSGSNRRYFRITGPKNIIGVLGEVKEENEAFRARARQEAQDEMDYYVSYYLTEDTDEARAALQAEAEQYYAGYEEELLEELRYEAAYDRWAAELKPAEINDDTLKDLYEQYVAEDEELFADDVFMYEYYLYYGYYPFYTPAGYRRIRMIELQADAALLNAWAEAQNAFEEGAEGADADLLIINDDMSIANVIIDGKVFC